MEKNTIIAIVLSTLVIFVSMFIQYNYYSPKQQTADENATEQTVSETGENQAEEADGLENDVMTVNELTNYFTKEFLMPVFLKSSESKA